MPNYHFTGKISAANRIWKRIFIKTQNVEYVIAAHGSWTVNKHWGPIDARGNPAYLAGSDYRGPGWPEGCLLYRIGNGNIHRFEGLTINIPRDAIGPIYIAGNVQEHHLKDCHGSLDYSIDIDFVEPTKHPINTPMQVDGKDYKYVITYSYPGPLSCLSGSNPKCSDVVDAGAELGIGSFCNYMVLCAGLTVTIFYDEFRPIA